MYHSKQNPNHSKALAIEILRTFRAVHDKECEPSAGAGLSSSAKTFFQSLFTGFLPLWNLNDPEFDKIESEIFQTGAIADVWSLSFIPTILDKLGNEERLLQTYIDLLVDYGNTQVKFDGGDAMAVFFSTSGNPSKHLFVRDLIKKFKKCSKQRD